MTVLVVHWKVAACLPERVSILDYANYGGNRIVTSRLTLVQQLDFASQVLDTCTGIMAICVCE